MVWEDFTEEQRKKYDEALNALVELATTGEQMMTIHQLRYEFGERFYLDSEGKKLDFLEYVKSIYRSSRPVWFLKYIEEENDKEIRA